MKRLLLVLFLFSLSFGQKKINIKGTVNDIDGNPVPFTNVYIINTMYGNMADKNGKFSFICQLSENNLLVATIVGYKDFSIELDADLVNGDITIVLEKEVINLEEVVVTGSSFSTVKGKGIVVSSREIYTTPGGAADIFQAIKNLPGIQLYSESAELYVRGGNPSETTFLIDQGTLYHPFMYENSSGALFSNINTSLVGGLYFSSGGFSAKYGNALSGVLDLKSSSEIEKSGTQLGVSLANVSFSTSFPIIPNVLSVEFYGRKNFTSPMEWLNGKFNDFTNNPDSDDFTALAKLNYSKTGKAKFFFLLSNDKMGVNINSGSYFGEYRNNGKKLFINGIQSDVISSGILLKNSLSYSKYSTDMKIGIVDLKENQHYAKMRSDLEIIIDKSGKFNAGIEAEILNDIYRGKIPTDDFNLESNWKTIDKKITRKRTGAYLETKFSNLFCKGITLSTGLRSDYFPEAKYLSFDPRMMIGYSVNDKMQIKFSTGIYHQMPDYRLFNSNDANYEKKSMQAEHYILSLDYNIDKANSLRGEMYFKNYSNLPLENSDRNYSRDGHGYAFGLDLMYKYSLAKNLGGWISYGYIDTKRKWLDYITLTSSDYDISHNLAFVTRYSPIDKLEFGMTYKYATGRPITPVTGANYLEAYNVYEPIEGVKNSIRLPDYNRLDFRITYLNQFFDKYFLVAYVEMLNVLDKRNTQNYYYNEDYSERQSVKSYFGKRIIVVGFMISM